MRENKNWVPGTYTLIPGNKLIVSWRLEYLDLGYRLEGQAENHRSSREVPGPVENGGSRPW